MNEIDAIKHAFAKRAAWLIIKMIIWLGLIVGLIAAMLSMLILYFQEGPPAEGRGIVFWSIFIAIILFALIPIRLLRRNIIKQKVTRRVYLYQKIIEKLLYLHLDKKLSLIDLAQLSDIDEKLISRELDAMLNQGRIKSELDENNITRYGIIIR
jgi:ABC-type multidrug transport system fused ATPase/permease subunit